MSKSPAQISKKPRGKAPLAVGMRFIVGLKMLQGLLLAGVGIGLILLRNHAANTRVLQLLWKWQLDADALLLRHLLHLAMRKLGAANVHQFVLLGLAAFLYSLVTLTEGVGLWAQKFWAEYLTAGVSASFVPLEAWEVALHPKIGTLVLMLINIAVVVYLVNRLRIQHRAKTSHV